ncbi:MAG: RipA family octameric membrane protein [Pseudomonadota bacterium]
MKLFVIHRFKDRKKAAATLKNAAKDMGVSFRPIFLNSNGCDKWKDQALNALGQVEAVIVYDRPECESSHNAKWEIAKAEEANLPVVDIATDDSSSDICAKLKPLYDLEEDFNSCFKGGDKESILELYKLMIASSESLIRRRQRTNAFFITVIGSLLAIAGLMVKTGVLNLGTMWLLYGFSVTGLLLCNSWRNLIDNYGKLNKAKFDVILRLEKDLDASIYDAEWVALGKGLRPEKYRSFTSTEKHVPLFFALLIASLTTIAVVWHING